MYIGTIIIVIICSAIVYKSCLSLAAVNTLTARVVNGVSGQQSPCLGQDVVFTCTFPAGQPFVDMIVLSSDENPDEQIILTMVFGSQSSRTATLLGSTLTANLTSSTSAELLIEAIDSVLNRSTVICEIPGRTPPHPLMISVLGERIKYKCFFKYL